MNKILILFLFLSISCKTLRKNRSYEAEFERAVMTFQNEKFNQSIKSFEELYIKYPSKPIVVKYLAQSYIAKMDINFFDIYEEILRIKKESNNKKPFELEKFLVYFPDYDEFQVKFLLSALSVCEEASLKNKDNKEFYDTLIYYQFLYFLYLIKPLNLQHKKNKESVDESDYFDSMLELLFSEKALKLDKNFVDIIENIDKTSPKIKKILSEKLLKMKIKIFDEIITYKNVVDSNSLFKAVLNVIKDRLDKALTKIIFSKKNQKSADEFEEDIQINKLDFKGKIEFLEKRNSILNPDEMIILRKSEKLAKKIESHFN